MMLRPLIAVLVAAGGLAGAPRAAAAPGCAPGGAPAPPGAASRQIGDVDGDGLPDTLWVGKWQGQDGAMTRAVGIATASGANSDVRSCRPARYRCAPWLLIFRTVTR